jgi:chorismate mutase/prephenate dehydratase
MAKNISELRKGIEDADRAIIRQLEKRLELAKGIGELKKKEKRPVYDASQEELVLKKAKAVAGKIPEKHVEAIFRDIISASRSAQQPVKVAYLGPETTFTHMAAIKEFGRGADYIACNSIAEVFEKVEKDAAEFGVVPVENSTEGTINYTLDMFIYSNLEILREIPLPVVHNLISNSGINGIKKVYSHPQAFAQCRKWLAKNLPKAELIETSSTTKGAESTLVYHSSAAIASALAAEKFRLKIAAENIGDNPYNVTRFLVIGTPDKGTKATGKDKTSLMFSVKHKSGALFNALKPLHDCGVNMTKIESRPTKIKTWEYVFFVDVQGFREDAKIKKVRREMEKWCGFVKVLGSYPEKA